MLVHDASFRRDAVGKFETFLLRVYVRGFNAKVGVRLLSLSRKTVMKSFGRLAFAQSFQAIAEAALQRSGGVGIKSYQVPQGLAAIFAEPG
jgi:hypothetical protein